MSLTIKNTPFYWYTYKTQFSLQLLESYINTVEKQIQISIENYKDKKETIIIEEDPVMNTAYYVDTHNGLDSQTWDLDEIFLEHFPNIQRKSALLTLYSFLENELTQLCLLFKETNKFTVELNDLHGKGISKTIIYLKKVIGLQIDDWKKIHDIRQIRNLVAHNDGRLLDSDGKPRNEINIVNRTELLNGQTDLKIEDGYLQNVLKTFKTQFEILDKEIKARYPDK